MLAAIDPAANIYWSAVGTIMDENGTQEISPGTTAEWAAVRHAATIIAESGNLLLMPDRARDDERWTRLSQQLITTGRQALEAAESRDPMAVFVAGGQVYLVCSECHAAFAPDALRSSFGAEN